ncbi:MAG: peptidylprolyl isomerase [Sphingomonadales bacterium]
MLKKLLNEPFVYFLLIGGGIFLGFGQKTQEKPIIEITLEKIESLTDKDPKVLSKIINTYFESEILFREGLKRGLHKGDAGIRDQIIISMQYLLAGQIEMPEEDILKEFYNNNTVLYTTETKVSFNHYFFENDPSSSAVKILENLEVGTPPEGTDDFWLGNYFNEYEEPTLRQILGDNFWRELNKASLKTWVGPLRSKHGYHFIKVGEIEVAQTLSYGFVKDRVLEDWYDTQRRRKISDKISLLKENYTLIQPDQK